MRNTSLVRGLIFLGCGLAASSLGSFVTHFMLFGASTDFACGCLAGMAVIFFCAAIWFLSLSRQAAV